MTNTIDPLYVSAAYRKPFDLDAPPTRMKFDPSMTLAQMVDSFYMLPPDFAIRGEITVGGKPWPRALWATTRLKPGVDAMFFYPPGGGGGSGGKRSKGGLLALVIGIASILTAGLALTGAFATTSGFFLVGSTSAKVLAGVITVAGQLAQKALTAPPTQKDDAKTEDTKGSASASGNLLEPGAAIPRVLGTMKIFPSLVTQPFTYRQNTDEWVEAVFALAGPHKLENIRLGDFDIAGAQDVQYQTREGWDYDSPIDLVSRYAVTRQPGVELSTHDVIGDDQRQLRNQVLYGASLPIFHGAPASDSPDQINIDLTFLEGLYDTTDTDSFQRVAFRVRLRSLSTGTIYNLPELHYVSKLAREIRPSIVLKWADPLTSVPVMTTSTWNVAFYTVPAQVTPPMGGWQADASFYAGSGDTYLSPANPTTSGVIRSYHTSDDEMTFHLDATAIPRGRYQVEIQRSMTLRADDFGIANYVFNGNVIDLFGYTFDNTGTAIIARKRVNLADRVGLVRVSSVYNQHPIYGGQQGSGLALIVVKAKNRAIENLSVMASGYMKDWDGSNWDTLTISSNPGTQMMDVFRGPLTPDPLELAVIDNQSVVDFRQHCIDMGYTCNMICEGDAINDILETIASCGYARPRMSERWGVIQDYDRSAEPPAQIFTAANSYGMTMENDFARLPDALRVIWTDALANYESGEEIVFRPGVPEVADPRLEQMTYRGLVTKADAVKRAIFDLKQVQLRAATWSFNAAAEAIRSTRGDLIAINHDFISQFHDSGRIIDVTIVSGQITKITVDRVMPVYNEVDMLNVPNMLTVPDMLLVGAKTSVSIRESTGLISTHAASGSGSMSVITFATPIPVDNDDDGTPTIRYDCLVWVGASGTEYKRLVVRSITYDKNMTAQIEAVAEAPELWAA